MSRFRTEGFLKRVVLVVVDGLRADAIERFELRVLARLVETGASTLGAQTVQPSVTACAMASLMTGAAPSLHGFQSDRFSLPRPTGNIHPLPRLLRDHGLPTTAFLARMPLLMNPLAHRLSAIAGVQKATFSGQDSSAILTAADYAIKSQKDGLIVMHWPDADRAGHANGWMSPMYARAARNMDDALGELVARIYASKPETLLIVLADHGGGGVQANEHESPHVLNQTIPIVFSGRGVTRGSLGSGVTITDVPATILWGFGIARPESYAGRPLSQAFRSAVTAVSNVDRSRDWPSSRRLELIT